LPAPSQAPIGMSVEPLHIAEPQLVPAGVKAQAPLPLQVPLVPQVVAPAQPP
jgi:hypothetical protein